MLGDRRKTRGRTGENSLSPLLFEILYTNLFGAEWGDRSQIATIALATHKNAVGFAVGALSHLRSLKGRLLLLEACFSLSSYFYPPL
ncbi:hypothetical protein K2173_009323 [Erythroxylum novogranatense]|uniref:GDT1 family protein n=1 Tax=Erythroxylum novogranatense TaxID=1862640 RepID=A0AAV8U3M6_9ROSI|nr:hypothetical protein K2173_009323 [Erythroxylum novogranatense]